MSGYGSIAETAEYPEDKSWIIFNLRPEARFTDGVPITAHDFCFGFRYLQGTRLGPSSNRSLPTSKAARCCRTTGSSTSWRPGIP